MCLHLKKNICLFKIMKSKELSKKYKKNFQYIRKNNSRQNLFILTTAGDCKRLLALLATPGDCWRLLATPGVVCILVVPVVPNKKIRYILFQVSHSKTYKIYCKELVQATCKITSKIKM